MWPPMNPLSLKYVPESCEASFSTHHSAHPAGSRAVVLPYPAKQHGRRQHAPDYTYGRSRSSRNPDNDPNARPRTRQAPHNLHVARTIHLVLAWSPHPIRGSAAAWPVRKRPDLPFLQLPAAGSAANTQPGQRRCRHPGRSRRCRRNSCRCRRQRRLSGNRHDGDNDRWPPIPIPLATSINLIAQPAIKRQEISPYAGPAYLASKITISKTTSSIHCHVTPGAGFRRQNY